MGTHFLEALHVPEHNPLSILPSLEKALAGQASYAPYSSFSLPSSYGIGQRIEDCAFVISTSGSTGLPKGAILSPENLISSANATHEFLGGAGQWVLALPAQHIAGMQVLIRSFLAGYEPLCMDLSQKFSVEQFISLTHKAAQASAPRIYTSLTPMLLMKIMDTLAGIDALRVYDSILVGGGPIDDSLCTSCAALDISIVRTYGSSETAGGMVYDGLALPGGQYICEEDGCISLGGPMVARGYRNADSSVFFKPGWWRTSDYGEIKDNRLVIIGRIDNVINTGGLKIAPESLEATIRTIKGINQCCVIGVPDAQFGQRLAVVYSGTATDFDIIEALEDLPRWQLPRQFFTVDALPLLPSGKIDRQKINRRYASPAR